ncbi:type II toxin-antitoxin system RelB/DinJ family antitoxin [Agrobacterium larrymoorei]|uniref:Type II toxin-antitoxin system RelB/DinJ family antitoxin n=1 Tax=Agrobacterium larrymoorei TaxID=160699 RepID=A0A4D7DQ05_9HYPH|nr:type II toxin-antitoxin system RelB/DinJ family antitoxin [Agrobacterium larrymoorei]QCI98358.1 type II toxin-antitoxin system RelB/DinJ family antitoxin [Agrobacterium larrymoorei]QYA06186.1 type II toxin-antitoxin system RelB/DinJ family antitoxin [Agrobacterium larrymoorei]
MTANAYVRARIDQEIKDDATAVLDSLGLTVSDVMRMMLTRIAREKALPIELTRPNAETLAAMEEARAIARAKRERFRSAEEIIDALDGGKQ